MFRYPFRVLNHPENDKADADCLKSGKLVVIRPMTERISSFTLFVEDWETVCMVSI